MKSESMVSEVSVVDEVPVEQYGELGLSEERLLMMFRKMLLIRRFEERVERLFFDGKLIGPSHLYLGQEAVAVGVMEALRPEDIVVSTYRGHGHALARGVPPESVMAELFGKASGTCKGVGGSMHVAMSVEHNIPMATAIVGSGIPIGAGIALALKYRREERIAAVFFGDGAVNTGAFSEGINLASVWRLPALFICENNQYSEFTPIRSVFAGESIAARASSYGLKAFQAFGNDVAAVYRAAKSASEHVRSGNGPAFIEFRTYRMKGHGVYDTAWYRPKEEVEEWMRKEPITLFSSKLREAGLLDDARMKKIEDEVREIIDHAVEEAEKAPYLPFNELYNIVYAGEE